MFYLALYVQVFRCCQCCPVVSQDFVAQAIKSYFDQTLASTAVSKVTLYLGADVAGLMVIVAGKPSEMASFSYMFR